tara:strand:- start:611 stop:871 length:261 start_codon:yes stop_codon:yes gene_type:complete
MAGSKKSKYMAGGGKSSKYMAGGGKTTKGRASGGKTFMGGGATERGKEAKVQTYKEYVQKMFGGGMTNGKRTKGSSMGGPAIKRNR